MRSVFVSLSLSLFLSLQHCHAQGVCGCVINASRIHVCTLNPVGLFVTAGNNLKKKANDARE